MDFLERFRRPKPKAPEISDLTLDNTSTTEIVALGAFRAEIDACNIPGVNSSKLIMEDRLIWESIKSGTPINEGEIEEYERKVLSDSMDAGGMRRPFLNFIKDMYFFQKHIRTLKDESRKPEYKEIKLEELTIEDARMWKRFVNFDPPVTPAEFHEYRNSVGDSGSRYFFMNLLVDKLMAFWDQKQVEEYKYLRSRKK